MSGKSWNRIGWYYAIFFVAFTVAILLQAGCTAPVKPENPRETLMAAYATYSGVTNTVADLTTSGRISVSRAKYLQAQLLDVHRSLKAADALLAGVSGPVDEGKAIQLMQAAIVVLNQLATELSTQEGGAP